MSRHTGAASLGNLIRLRPRYLLHGVVAAVGVAALSSFALQPRPEPVPLERPTPVEEMSPVVALNLETTLTPMDPAIDTPVAAAPESQPPPDVAPAPEPAAPPPAKPSVHTVEDGETLGMIAARFSISPETIMAANGLRDADMLKVGQDLVILPTDGVLYVVKPGESIRRVAERFGVDTMDIVNANELGSDPDIVQAGTMLMVPGATPVVAKPNQGTVRASEADQTAATVGSGGAIVPIDVTTTHSAPSTRTYTVQPGDTLAHIADTFGVDVPTMLASNGIDDPDTIKPGSELRILPVKGVEYAVQPNETLADISYKYQVDLGLLLDYNDLSDPDVINIGSKLVIPGGKLRTEPAPAPAVQAPAPRT
ncbi:MAG: LysM peptidoglycan-binding domain-containing protein, partial [Chloroflexota bacterium]|nr:LysM peptidoglycan-binding domain-containing protein [Chloroflexota bacterium]